jgi:hypothetical protein
MLQELTGITVIAAARGLASEPLVMRHSGAGDVAAQPCIFHLVRPQSFLLGAEFTKSYANHRNAP